MTYVRLKIVAVGVIGASALSACSASGHVGEASTDRLVLAVTQGPKHREYLELMQEIESQNTSILPRVRPTLRGQLDRLRVQDARLANDFAPSNADERELKEALRHTNDRLARLVDRVVELEAPQFNFLRQKVSYLLTRQIKNSTDPQHDVAMFSEIDKINADFGTVNNLLRSFEEIYSNRY